VALLLVDEVHQLLELFLGLETLFFGFSRLLGLLLHDVFLLLVGFVHIVGFNLESDQVSLHSGDHMVVSSLEHEFKVMLILDLC
jgi:hypothetical protein